MRAAVVLAPDTLPVCADFAEPQPQPGEGGLELVGAGVHQVVRSVASGRHYGSTHNYPLVPGVDAVARRSDGQLVYAGWIREPWGTMAERMAARFGLPLPAGVDPLAVAAGMNPASSGWPPLAQHVREQGSLGCVAVLGATGMAGGLAVQAAFALGAERVVAAGRDREQLERLTATGATTVELDAPDADAALAAAFGAPTPTLVLDYVWGPVAEQAFAALARRGLEDDSAAITYTQIGSLAGATAALPASLLRSRNLRVVGSGAGSTSRAAYLEHLPRLLGLIADGTLTVDYSAYELASVAAAWEHRGRSRAVLVP